MVDGFMQNGNDFPIFIELPEQDGDNTNQHDNHASCDSICHVMSGTAEVGGYRRVLSKYLFRKRLNYGNHIFDSYFGLGHQIAC
ncbi:MAG: hypothetical protein ACYTF1_11985 [Planctomycetota bacterium]